MSGRFKRGQMEMVGLVVIVILVTIAFLFLTQFALNDKSDHRAFDRKQLAVSTLTAAMRTTVLGCSPHETEPLAVEQILLDDCAENRDPLESVYHCKSADGTELHSCQFLQEVLFPELLKKSFDPFKQRYEFKSVLVNDPENPLITSGSGCKGRDTDTSGEFSLNTDHGLVSSVLLVCD